MGWSLPYDDLIETAARVGISERRFWSMTPAAFHRRANYVLERRQMIADRDRQREENALYRAAWVCATIMNFAGKQLKDAARTVKPEELLRKKQTPAAIDEKRRVLIERHGLDERFGITTAAAA